MKNHLSLVSAEYLSLLQKAGRGELSWVPDAEALINIQFDTNYLNYCSSQYMSADMEVTRLGRMLEKIEQLQDVETNRMGLIFKDCTGADLDRCRTGREEGGKQITPAGIPSFFDWREVNGLNYITPVKLQGICNSCTAFSLIACMESLFHIQTGIPVTDKTALSLSEQHLFFHHPSYMNNRCDCNTGFTGPIEEFLDYLEEKGILPACYCGYHPYNPLFLPPLRELKKQWEKAALKITGYEKVSGTARMKELLCTRGPLIARLAFSNDFFLYRSGIYTSEVEKKEGIHFVLVTGYDEKNGAWIGKNSWGIKWGEAGFFRIRYGECEVDKQMWHIKGIAGLPE